MQVRVVAAARSRTGAAVSEPAGRRLLEPVGDVPQAEFELTYYRQVVAQAIAA
jgi:hypothetical protein